ncbi:hypothetical protein PPERSA_12642 [Pseudocohnilembus persalinus]|uniref:poly(ADP-ribose) glycohydrolase n=1 Tax=Pseudocohnilembus persalinus TaxID=266149 RepID=A0A0V0QLZ6_PSEPJ|nr:hypothetical protein PPERSA_12642 [Pseudocohnilembus persalinus]|eukprot:KRX03363.1 hypothetical protein PPERSA_12642 [Pseudocohnilembus persalinus]
MEKQQQKQFYFRLTPYYQDIWEKLSKLISKQFESIDDLIHTLQDINYQIIPQFYQSQIKNLKINKYHFPKQGEYFPYQSLRASIEFLQKKYNINFLKDLLPQIQKSALNSQHLFKDINYEILILKADSQQTLSLSKQQTLSINSLAFFNSLLDVHNLAYFHKEKYDDQIQIGILSFEQLYVRQLTTSEAQERIKCLLYYFYESFKINENQKIQYHRLVLDNPPKWDQIDEPISIQVNIQTQGMEESDAFYQVDFANKYLQIHQNIPSLTQEEVIFTIRPDIYPVLLISDMLNDNEAIIIEGARMFCNYTGYSSSFRFSGPSPYLKLKDISAIIAIDALVSSSVVQKQCEKNKVFRELNKAYIGFKGIKPQNQIYNLKQNTISTGGWGCGVFGGNQYLKFLQQLIAAQLAKKDLVYSAYKDKDRQKQFEQIYSQIIKNKINTKQLLDIILNFANQTYVYNFPANEKKEKNENFYDYLQKQLRK